MQSRTDAYKMGDTKIMCWLSKLFSNQATVERPSPDIRIKPEQADTIIKLIKTVPGYENCFIAAIAPTNSMEPGIDDGMYVILDPRPYLDLIVGDIIWYEHPSFKAIHRITRIGLDNNGWFAETKGDNNSAKDPERVRPEHIKGVWRATID